MKIFTAISALTIASFCGSLLMSGCSSSTTVTTPNTSIVTMTTETDGSRASSAFWKNSNSPASGIAADSVEITRVRFLLSAVKLHVEGNDTTKDAEIKTGPFILVFTPGLSGLSSVFSTDTIPSGSYEKIKFEIHKFPSSIDQKYLDDPTFKEFVTPERSTVIIEGKVWPTKIKDPVNFIYDSHITANVEAKFQGSITLDAGQAATLALVFSPKLAFKFTNVLDPRDPGNTNDIDSFLKTAIYKALKK